MAADFLVELRRALGTKTSSCEILPQVSRLINLILTEKEERHRQDDELTLIKTEMHESFEAIINKVRDVETQVARVDSNLNQNTTKVHMAIGGLAEKTQRVMASVRQLSDPTQPDVGKIGSLLSPADEKTQTSNHVDRRANDFS